MESSKSLKTTLLKASEEIRILLADLKAGTLDRIALEAGLKEVQERLKVMDIHIHSPDPDSDPKPERK